MCIKTSDAGTFNIGLPRYGEMFAIPTQLSYNDAMWLINRYSTLAVWSVEGKGNDNSTTGPSNERLARPTLHLKSTVKILSGSGTENDPYIVGL